MRVIGKDRTGCDACNPLDEIIARIEQLERRVVTIVARVQGIPPDGTGTVTLPTSDSVDGPLYGNTGVFAMSSEVKEAADDVHQYASAIADDVVVLQSDVEILTREVEALDPASVNALEQSVAALQQSVNRLSNTVAGYSAVIGDLEDQMPNKVDRTGDTMTGPLNVIDTATGSRNTQAVNGNRLQNDLDNYAPMFRLVGNQNAYGIKNFYDGIVTTEYGFLTRGATTTNGWIRVASFAKTSVMIGMRIIANTSYIEAMLDIRTTSTTIKCETKGEIFTVTNIKVCDDGSKYHIFVKYPFNRLFHVDIMHLRTLYGGRTLSLTMLEKGDGTIEAEPTDYVAIYTSEGY